VADHRTNRKTATPGAGVEPFGITRHDEPYSGRRGTLQERVARAGHPLQLLPITPFVGVSALGLYPADGAGIALGGGPDPYIDLAADGPAHGLAGLGLACWDETPTTGWEPELWRIASYNTGTKRAQLAAWSQDPGNLVPHTPRAGSRYLLGVITWQREWLRMAAEYEAASTPAVVIPHYSDLNWEPPSSGDDAGQLGVFGTARAMRWASGARLTLDNLGSTALLRQPGYIKGRTRSEECLGGVLAKLEIVVLPTTGKVSLCASAT
jgi:hypothetical protein